MKIRIIIFVLTGILLGTFTGNSQTAIKKVATDSVNVTVTFLFNTSTIPDTILSTSTLQIRGNTYPPFTWDNLSTVNATNIGGDYWTATGVFHVARDSTRVIQYKAFTNVNSSITAADKGWENSFFFCTRISSNNGSG